MTGVTYIGCDPGQFGAIVAITPDEGVMLQAMPLTKHKVIDCIRVGEFIDSLSHNDIYFAIEKVHAMPKQGVSSVFKFGYSTGMVEGAVVSRASGNGVLRSTSEVRPQEWKKYFGLIKTPKEAAVEKAKELCPKMDFSTFNKKLQSGIADAYLIARYLRDKILVG